MRYSHSDPIPPSPALGCGARLHVSHLGVVGKLDEHVLELLRGAGAAVERVGHQLAVLVSLAQPLLLLTVAAPS